MQRLPLEGVRVADLGAGSAVLAIAAAKLGARTVTAVELDPDAIGNANENVERNGVADIVHVVEGDALLLLPLVAPVDVIFANIVSSVHKDLVPVMARAMSDRAHAVLSGILVEERGMMSEMLATSGWHIDDEDVEDIWWSATISRH
jgi:ribosomal protein L11 methyltransferase